MMVNFILSAFILLNVFHYGLAAIAISLPRINPGKKKLFYRIFKKSLLLTFQMICINKKIQHFQTNATTLIEIWLIKSARIIQEANVHVLFVTAISVWSGKRKNFAFSFEIMPKLSIKRGKKYIFQLWHNFITTRIPFGSGSIKTLSSMLRKT